ncbi:hypothetical protein EZV62_005909 [Acer yangbiense]|uniref:Uncharacterized protein n=1 Tax=Acer yangbiense TaxID=1000413 RepID=A0A5C7IQ93_9ROSI|nr:hypothetical protein EZV62_005909 [Acer yangbiense]
MLPVIISSTIFNPMLARCFCVAIQFDMYVGTIIWVLDEGFTCGGKEKTRESESKKELSMARASENFFRIQQSSSSRCVSLQIPELTFKTHSLMFDYFSETANASFMFSRLLKDLDHVRVSYRSFKTLVKSLEDNQFSFVNHFPSVRTRFTELSNSLNPFAHFAPSPSRVRVIQAGCSKLLKQLELSRDKARTKLRIINLSEHGSAFILIVVTASLTVIIATHALALLVTAPGLIAASLELASTRRLARVPTQLDAAAKGTYILNRDLDTISRLMARLNDELEHMRSMVKFWLERGEARLQASCEMARQLMKNDASFSQQLNELEEHLYLCFMTVNRARNLVVKEILDPGHGLTRNMKMM